MKKVILIFSATFLINQFSLGQNKQELIKELFTVMKQDSMMELMGKSFAKSIFLQNQSMKKSSMLGESQNIKVSTENLDRIEKANKNADISISFMKKFVNNELLIIYGNHYTENEIKDYIQFYKSNSGQKFLWETSKIQSEIMIVMNQKYLPEMIKEMKSK